MKIVQTSTTEVQILVYTGWFGLVFYRFGLRWFEYTVQILVVQDETDDTMVSKAAYSVGW